MIIFIIGFHWWVYDCARKKCFWSRVKCVRCEGTRAKASSSFPLTLCTRILFIITASDAAISSINFVFFFSFAGKIKQKPSKAKSWISTIWHALRKLQKSRKELKKKKKIFVFVFIKCSDSDCQNTYLPTYYVKVYVFMRTDIPVLMTTIK